MLGWKYSNKSIREKTLYFEKVICSKSKQNDTGLNKLKQKAYKTKSKKTQPKQKGNWSKSSKRIHCLRDRNECWAFQRELADIKSLDLPPKL